LRARNEPSIFALNDDDEGRWNGMALILDPHKRGDAPGRAGDVVSDCDVRTFAADVIEASMRVPVIVDFWAPWCGPCKQLGPILEKLVRQAGGLVRLVKVNVDENQDLAAQLRVQSIPAVYAFFGGRPVDAFVGAQPESKLRAFVERLTHGAKPPLEQALERAQTSLDAGDAKAAAKMFQQILSEDPTNPKAVAGLVRCRVALKDLSGARQLVAGLPPDLARNVDIAAATAAIDLAEQSRDSGDTAALRRRLETNPDDHAARLALATALYAAGRSEAAVDELLDIIRRDRAWNDEAARKQLVKVFDALGAQNPLTVASRRRLSSLLFS
jgi:putative thioredoxin